MSSTRRTMLDVVSEIRADLDEPLDATGNSNFWSQTDIVLRVNRGLRQVWQLARMDKGSRWFVRNLRSTDKKLDIFGRPYNPAALQVQSNATELILPPDFGELLLFEPITDAAGTLPSIQFRFTKLSGRLYAQLSRIASGSSEYWCDVVQRLEGPRLVMQPPFEQGPVDTRIEYLVKPDNYALADTFEGLGFDDLMLDAVIAYAEVECWRKADNPEKLKEALATWGDRKALVLEEVGPHQTVEHEVVQGFMEEEW